MGMWLRKQKRTCQSMVKDISEYGQDQDDDDGEDGDMDNEEDDNSEEL